MKISEALRDITHLFLDTAPVIYFVEKHPTYLDLVAPLRFHSLTRVMALGKPPVLD